MKTKSLLLFCIMVVSISFAQEKMSKADKYFYSYAYNSAIAQYKNEMRNAPLKNNQMLNLADAYYKLGDFENASKIYLDINKIDTTMSSHRFNKLLQSLAKTSNMDRVKSFLSSKRTSFSKELLENADFNFELLESISGDTADFNIFNIAANSPQADFASGFFKEKLLFTSARTQKAKSTYEPSGESYFDIYVGQINSDGNVFSANTFTQIPESKFHKATPYFSEELGKLFYILSNTTGEGELRFNEEGKNSLAIGMADTNGNFSFLLKDLGTSFYYPFFDTNSSRLYFAADLDDSYGGTDIYYVHTNNGQIMSEPTNLGPRINSPGNEIAPYIVGNSLYFSSDIFYGIGGMDVYKSRIDSDRTFGIPINLGKGINTESDEFGFILKDNGPAGLTGYFSSNRNGGKGNDDIYGFKTMESLGLKTFALKGRVVNLNSNNGVAKAQLRLMDKDGNVIKEVYCDDDGQFRFEIPWREQVTLQVTKERHSVFQVSYDQSEYEDVQQTSVTMGISFVDDLLSEQEEKSVIKLDKFYFDKGKAIITPVIQAELDKVVDAVQRFPQMKLQIETHTDSRGSSANNKRLSQQRADAIKLYLLKSGLSSTNITSSVGYGEEKITNNCTDGVYCLEFLHKKNDRSLIVVANADEL